MAGNASASKLHNLSFKTHLVRLGKTNFAKIVNRSLSTRPTAENHEYTNTPEYPSIVDNSRAARKERIKKVWHDELQSLKSVEEKLFAVNIPKYYGWKCMILNESAIPYNMLPLTQFITRTHLIEGLPKYYSEIGLGLDIETKSNLVVAKIKSQVEEALILEHAYKRTKYGAYSKNSSPTPSQTANDFGKAVSYQINRILLSNLASDFDHLLRAQVDIEPRVEAFWFTGGIDPPAKVQKTKEKVDFLKAEMNDPIDRTVQYLGSPHLHLRCNQPLREFVPLTDYDESELLVPAFTYDPRVLGVTHDFRHGTNIPGFWPGDQSEFGLVSYHHRGHLLERPPHYGSRDRVDCLTVQAILASYGWTLGQACYQGFSSFNDVSYPMVTQTIITDGQTWSFYAYQLNTTVLHSEYAITNPRRNICWATKEIKLFEEIQGDTIIGFNDDVLQTLIKFYLNEPKVRDGVVMKPYLDPKESYIADMTDKDRRIWYETQFKHMYSNKPRHRLQYEVYDWERIYKIDNNTRPLDKKTRPFELGINPYSRKYTEHQPPYVPKKFRPEDKKNKNKWSKTFYPKL